MIIIAILGLIASLLLVGISGTILLGSILWFLHSINPTDRNQFLNRDK